MSIHVTIREGRDDGATTKSGLHHYPIHVWKCPHSDELPDPVVSRPFCVFGSAVSCLRVPNDVGGALCVTDVTQLTVAFCESVVAALTQMLRRNTTREHIAHTRKVSHVISILSAQKAVREAVHTSSFIYGPPQAAEAPGAALPARPPD